MRGPPAGRQAENGHSRSKRDSVANTRQHTPLSETHTHGSAGKQVQFPVGTIDSQNWTDI